MGSEDVVVALFLCEMFLTHLNMSSSSTHLPDSIPIPLHNSSEKLFLSVSDISSFPANEIIDILQRERADLLYWLRIGMVYYCVDQVENFVSVLDAALDPALEQRYIQQGESRIKILNCLANYYLSINDSKKASDLVKTARSLDMINPLTSTTQGILELNQERPNLERARNLFASAVESDETLTPAFLGQARIQYHKGEYAKALKIYQQILRKDKDAPATVRLGIGLCFHRLGNDVKAKVAFERTLQLDPSNVDAHVGVAVIQLNDATSQEDPTQRALLVKQAMETLGRAYKMQNTHPMILTHLARHYFFRQQYGHVEKLARNAFHRTSENSIKALASFQIAKSKHAQQLYDEAFELYSDIVSTDPEFILGRFGLAQLLIHRGELAKAIPHFEFIVSKEPNSFEVHRILGHLFLHTHSRERALYHLRKSYEIRSADSEMLVELAQVNTDAQESIQLMKAAEQIIEDSEEQQKDFFFFTDYGNVHYKAQDYATAESYYKRAIELEYITTEKHEQKHVLLLYNFARNYEAWGGADHIEKSKEIYLALIKNHPSFIESYLRLGNIFMSENNSKKALKWIHLATKVNTKNPLPFVVLGFLHISRREWSHAQKQFEHIVNNMDKNHSYANLALGHIFYCSARDHKSEEKKQQRYMRYGAQFFEKSLSNDPSNTYAAVSMGAYIAEQGYVDTAKELFLKIRESTADIPEIWINLAHVEMCQGNFINAASMYEKCLQKIYQGPSVHVLELLAYAYYKEDKLDECMKTLKQALKIEPDNLFVQYNIAITHYTKANQLIAEKKKALDHALQASEEVLSCRVLFSSLATHSENVYISSKAQQFYDHTERTLESARKNEEKARTAQEHNEKMKLRQQEILLQVNERKAAKKREEQERARLEQERMKQEQARLHEIVEKQVQNLEQQREKALRRQSRQRDTDDQREQFSEEEVYEEVAPKKKKSTKKATGGKKKKLTRKKSKKNKEEDEEEIQFEGEEAPKPTSPQSEEELTFDVPESEERARSDSDEQGATSAPADDEEEEEVRFDESDDDKDQSKKRSAPDSGHDETEEPANKKQRAETSSKDDEDEDGGLALDDEE
mmetsp:Transcript_8317/g.30707  ORF Transcript_8317/g.30707 Transcript_8317/m.30707 type:complete len:1087 (-) Transcript_8317:39-3299(-)